MAKGNSAAKKAQAQALKTSHKDYLTTLRKALIDGTGKDRDVTKDADVQPFTFTPAHLTRSHIPTPDSHRWPAHLRGLVLCLAPSSPLMLDPVPPSCSPASLSQNPLGWHFPPADHGAPLCRAGRTPRTGSTSKSIS